MPQNGKLLYHLTALDNLESILQNGLQSRAALQENKFEDVADSEILKSRQQHGLDQFVPFHFFAKILLIMVFRELIMIRILCW
nr:DarT ssDNA thymidine ADP-ribosyltransferase family protein [Nitrincola nitratireducens]